MTETDALGQRVKVKVPIWRRWQKFQKFLEDNGHEESVKKHRRELFGALVIDHVPDDYHIMAMIRSLDKIPSEFNQLELDERAKLLAYIQIDNMMETLRRHDDIMDRRIKEKAREHAAKKN